MLNRTIEGNIRLYHGLYGDPRVPRVSKWLLWIAIGYTLLPFDIIPDFIPVLGHLDDALIVPLFLWLAIRMIPKDVYEEHRRRAFGIDSI